MRWSLRQVWVWGRACIRAGEVFWRKPLVGVRNAGCRSAWQRAEEMVTKRKRCEQEKKDSFQQTFVTTRALGTDPTTTVPPYPVVASPCGTPRQRVEESQAAVVAEHDDGPANGRWSCARLPHSAILACRCPAWRSRCALRLADELFLFPALRPFGVGDGPAVIGRDSAIRIRLARTKHAKLMLRFASSCACGLQSIMHTATDTEHGIGRSA